MKLRQFMRNHYGKHFYLYLILLVLLSFCSSAALFLVTYRLGQIIDSVSEGYQETLRDFQVIAAALLLSIVTSSLGTLCSEKMSSSFAWRLRKEIGAKICLAQYRQIEFFTDGELLTMATKDVDGFKNWLTVLAKTGCLPAQIGLPFLFIFQYDWRFALFTLCLLPLAAVPEAILAGRLHGYHTHEKDAYSKALSFFTTMAESLPVLKSFQLETLFQRKNQTVLDTYKKARMKRSLHEQLVDVYSRVFGHITNILFLILGAFFILAGDMTLGMLTGIILLANYVGEGLKVLNEIPVNYQGARASLAHLQPLLQLADEEDAIGQKERAGHVPVYEARSLAFGYGDRQVLDGISFRIDPGEKIAIAGLNGCGKSTLFKVLSGLYTPEKGQVFFQGTDIADIPPGYLRSQVTATTQETFLFQASFRENICMTDRDCKDSAMIQAAKNAGIHDLIQSSEQGYDTLIRTTVQTLSNGQAQRLNLARSFLRDTEVWLLDEPTSALDAGTTDQVMDHIFTACAGRTMLMILHNMQEMHRFDKVLLLADGKVAGFGPHATLLAECEAYRRLYTSEMTQEGTPQ